MKKRVLIPLAALLTIAVIFLLPRNRKINTTVIATEYCFADPGRTIAHTVTIRGTDTRNRLGWGRFEGTFAVSGFPSAEEGLTAVIRFPFDSQRPGSISFRHPSGYLSQPDLFSLAVNDDWTAFAGLIYETSQTGDHLHTSFSAADGRFLTSGSLPYPEACTQAAGLCRGTAMEFLFTA